MAILQHYCYSPQNQFLLNYLDKLFFLMEKNKYRPTVPLTSSSFSSPTMDFSMFLDSFANSIFNGTSTFAGVGTSIIDGIEVNGISLDKIQNQLSVTLSRTAATQVQGSNDNITSADTTITSL